MTEQEKRIEELGAAIEQLKCGKYRDCSSCNFKNYMFCQSAKLAKKLYDAGYRKADEVRKETAKEIIYGVANLLFEDCKEYGLDENKFADRFGVEVEK